MNRTFRRVALAATLSLVGACASGAAASGATRHNLVTAEELQRTGSSANLYDALRTIRPNFLRTRAPAQGASQEVPIRVYIGGMQMIDGMDHLRQVMARSVQEVEFLEPHQATTRFGSGNSGGALVIVMKP